jgi:membrane protease YdiL (CAAX protease family)
MKTLASKPTITLGWSPLLLAAWTVTLFVSPLPNILWQETTGQAASWLLWPKIVLLLALLAGSRRWPGLAVLRHYLLVFLVLLTAEWGSGQLAKTAWWQERFRGQASFSMIMLGTQLLRLGVALVMAALVLQLKRERRACFLVPGTLNATAHPVWWLGLNQPTSWSRLGPSLAVFISLGLLAFLLLAGQPSLAALGQVWPVLPAVLGFAMLNAFSEELSYRASLLAVVEDAVGSQQALMLTAALFGLGHFYGVPYGVVGVLLAGFLGWLLGKSMLETRGLFWAWLIHFVQDVLIFAFMAVGSITPGGG